jgi:hypothetical protein
MNARNAKHLARNKAIQANWTVNIPSCRNSSEWALKLHPAPRSNVDTLRSRSPYSIKGKSSIHRASTSPISRPDGMPVSIRAYQYRQLRRSAPAGAVSSIRSTAHGSTICGYRSREYALLRV